MKNYRDLSNLVKARLNPDNIILEKTFSDELGSVSYSDVLTYVRLAMKGVEPSYTNKSKEAGERVKDYLGREITNVIFRYQGSVMTNTHIKGFSDIDLLVISDKFYFYDSMGISNILNDINKRNQWNTTSVNKMEYEKSVSSYSGDSLEDLKTLRLKSEKVLVETYNICDTSKPKSIKIKNLSLNREVDVVVANWYDDVRSIINDKGDNRGIQVYNKELNRRGEKDFPFISINRINQKSSDTAGRLKKMIRFLKNLKSQCNQNLTLSSFDINAICFDIDSSLYNSLVYHELVEVLFIQLSNLINNEQLANSLASVDGREYILRSYPEKKRDLKILLEEVSAIYLDLKRVTIYG